MSFAAQYLEEVVEITRALDRDAIEAVVAVLASARAAGGRLFILGVGGSAANASHAVNDFRKIVGIETYAPTDNVSELTARTNDEGLGDGVRVLAHHQPDRRPRRGADSSRSAAAMPSGTSARISWPRSTRRRLPARASSGSSGVMAATRPGRPMPA